MKICPEGKRDWSTNLAALWEEKKSKDLDGRKMKKWKDEGVRVFDSFDGVGFFGVLVMYSNRPYSCLVTTVFCEKNYCFTKQSRGDGTLS